jgi:hypothetical protein
MKNKPYPALLRPSNLSNEIGKRVPKSRETIPLKGQSHEIFDPRFFSANSSPGSPDSWAKAILNINSYSRRYSIFKFDSALCRIARSRFLVSAIQKLFLLFFRQYVGKFTYG